MRGFAANGQVPLAPQGGFAAVGDAPGRFCGERASASPRGKRRGSPMAIASRGYRRGLSGRTRRGFAKKLEAGERVAVAVCGRSSGAASFPTVGI
jgi:hypothetical protein